MIHRHGASPFLNLAAVEAWDAWFRWRDQGELRDLSVDATWQRVASALASIEPEATYEAYRRQLLSAFASWRLVLDERLLATAGTPAAAWDVDSLVAVLNVACFVVSSESSTASLDLDALRDIAVLAVHTLDNAVMLHAGSARTTTRLRIGLMGFGDALMLLGIRYDSPTCVALAREVARTLALGCAIGTIALARQRTPTLRCDEAWKKRARDRGIPHELIDDAERHGMRYYHLTAITQQPRLALFANGVADALEPASKHVRTYKIESACGERSVSSLGYAMSLLERTPPNKEFTSTVKASATEAVCKAVQHWIDEPIAVTA